MKIELDNIADSCNRIDAYAAGEVTIARQLFTTSLLLSSDTIDTGWPPGHIAELERTHMEQIISLDPEIVILGTGRELHFPAESITRPLAENNIGLEIMDTGAACRSYNFLVGEGRRVVAALLMIEA